MYRKLYLLINFYVDLYRIFIFFFRVIIFIKMKEMRIFFLIGESYFLRFRKFLIVIDIR